MAKTKNDMQLAALIIDLFVVCYKEKYRLPPVINRATGKFPIADILKDISYENLIELVKYYFKIDTKHSFQDFTRTYHELVELKTETEKDALARKKTREETLRRVQQYREENR